MYRKHIFAMLIVVSSLLLPHTLTASDFEWRRALNLRAHSDPYGYRYGLANRFGIDESSVMLILSRVYEPSDAYMIFRFAELSGRSSAYVLRIYHERRAYGWYDIAYVLGIRLDRHDFIVLREHHDMRDVYDAYHYKRKERYEERYAPAPHTHHEAHKKHYVPEPKRHERPHHKASHREQGRHESKRDEAPKHTKSAQQNERYDEKKKHH